MKAREWTYVDRSKFYKAELLEGEPDKMQWQDEETGLPCLIVRHDRLGHLCGYVGVTSSHPDYEKRYDDVDVDVHGGLTFSDHCSENKEHGICHLVEEGDDDKVWWLGFDCAHGGDLSPGMRLSCLEFETYKDVQYVKNEIKELARQLKKRAKSDTPTIEG